jgi:hypothetical protein
MESLYGILHGLAVAIQPTHLLYTLIGVFIGTMISHLPGIGPSAGIALLIPVTFGMDPITALMMLTGIYYGCMYGGAVTAILLNTPGDAAAVMTVLDGYPMARKGRAAAALAIAGVSSFIAGMIGVTCLSFVAVPLAAVALHFGPTEYFALIFFALSTVGALNGNSIAKGMMAVFMGLGLATIGIDLQSGVPRFTMGLAQLQDRVSFLVVVVGLFTPGPGELSRGCRWALRDRGGQPDGGRHARWDAAFGEGGRQAVVHEKGMETRPSGNLPRHGGGFPVWCCARPGWHVGGDAVVRAGEEGLQTSRGIRTRRGGGYRRPGSRDQC